MKKAWLWLPPEWMHAAAPSALSAIAKFRSPTEFEWQPFEWRGIKFANRLGLAAGVDKNATQIRDWWTYGPGFIEVGTIVPKPQAPNQGRLIDRDVDNLAIWNKLGFPSQGLIPIQNRLRKLLRPYHAPLFLNIGKNRDTDIEQSSGDYVKLVTQLHPFADAFVINTSSPNTAGLRDLHSAEYLEKFLTPIMRTKETQSKPMLIKLSPDLSDSDLQSTIQTGLRVGIDGWVVTNTTLSRGEGLFFPKEGGVSGQPLAALSKKALRQVIKLLGPQRKDQLIVSVGGVMTPEDVFERLTLGADLVEIYSALIFAGPNFFSHVANHPLKLG